MPRTIDRRIAGEHITLHGVRDDVDEAFLVAWAVAHMAMRESPDCRDMVTPIRGTRAGYIAGTLWRKVRGWPAVRRDMQRELDSWARARTASHERALVAEREALAAAELAEADDRLIAQAIADGRFGADEHLCVIDGQVTPWF